MQHRKDRAVLQRRSAQIPANDPVFSKPVPPGDMESLVHELRRHETELELQNEELRRARDALEEYHTRVMDLYDHAPVGYVSLDRDGVIREINLAGVELFGVARSRIIGRSLPGFVSPEYREQFARHLNTVLAGASGESLDIALERPDAAPVSVRLRSNPELNGGAVTGARTALLDISDRKRAEEALRRSEEHHRVVSELISDLAYSLRIGPDGRTSLEWITGAFGRITGFSVSEHPFSSGWEDRVVSGDRGILEERMRTLLGGKPATSEFRITARNGAVRWMQDFARPVRRGTNGPVERIYGATRDITDRKRAEEALRESEEQYRTLARNSPDTILRFDRSYRIRYVNRTMPFAPDLDPARLAGRTMAEAGAPLDTALVLEEAVGTVLDTEQSFARLVEFEGTGGLVALDCRFVPERDGAGRVESVLCSCRDATALRRAEREIREREQRFRTLATWAPVGIFETDREGNCVFVNERWQQITGFSEAEALGGGCLRGLPPDDRERVSAAWAESSRSGRASFSLRTRFLTPDARDIRTELGVAVLRDDRGTITGFIGTLVEIAEH